MNCPACTKPLLEYEITAQFGYCVECWSKKCAFNARNGVPGFPPNPGAPTLVDDLDDWLFESYREQLHEEDTCA